MKRIVLSLTFLGGLGAAVILAGCSAGEENPITPDKMNEIRRKEAEGRGNFHPDMSGPGAGKGAPAMGATTG